MPNYTTNNTDKTRDFIVADTTGRGTGGQTNVQSAIFAGLAALEQRPEQGQAQLVRVRDFRG